MRHPIKVCPSIPLSKWHEIGRKHSGLGRNLAPDALKPYRVFDSSSQGQLPCSVSELQVSRGAPRMLIPGCQRLRWRSAKAHPTCKQSCLSLAISSATFRKRFASRVHNVSRGGVTSRFHHVSSMQDQTALNSVSVSHLS